MAKRKNSTYYELVKAKYESGEWTKKMLRLLVASGKITAAEYETITGEAY
jgi:hypothetical protein